MYLFGTLALAALAALLVWRPAVTLCLALIGAGVSVWRMNRPVKAPARDMAAPVRTPPPAPPAREAANENDDILNRLAAAGWETDAASPPWLVARQGRVRVALRTCTPGQEVTLDDVADAAAAKARTGSDFAAVVSLSRPADAVAAAAKAARVHIINLPRLEPYLALALSFSARREQA
jgi:hypothetical protein